MQFGQLTGAMADAKARRVELQEQAARQREEDARRREQEARRQEEASVRRKQEARQREDDDRRLKEAERARLEAFRRLGEQAKAEADAKAASERHQRSEVLLDVFTNAPSPVSSNVRTAMLNLHCVVSCVVFKIYLSARPQVCSGRAVSRSASCDCS